MNSLSKIDHRLTLEFLTQTREGQFFERKGCPPDRALKPAKLADELIGMLNASGGVIALGINDDGSIDDLNKLDPKLLDQFRKISHDCIAPPVCIFCGNLHGNLHASSPY